MNGSGPVRSVLVCAAVALLLAASVPAQQQGTAKGVAPGRIAANRAALKKFADAGNQLSPEVRKHLSRAMQNYLRYANAAVNAATPFGNNSTDTFGPRKKKTTVWEPWTLIPVCNDALDPAAEGYTQNTSSSAWCGNSVVVGYEDSGAFLRSDPSDVFGVPVSFDGVSVSNNAGKSFDDLGFLTPGAFSANFLIGDPSVTCSSAMHFQYASILSTTTPDGLDTLIGPSVSLSTDGGKTWSAPLLVAALDAGMGQIADSPWLAVDPTNAQRMYLTYTSIDPFGCNSINVVRSSDGGKIWSTPVIVEQQCFPVDPNASQNTVTGSRITVAEDGRVYVVYEFFPGFSQDVAQINAVHFASSANHGASFGKPLRVANLVPSGTGVELNGHLQVPEYPQIAVDRSSGHSRGTIYVTYPDGRNHVVADANAASGIYAYPDIVVAKSANDGKSFSALGAVNPTPKDFTGIGRDQFLPTVAVDKDGEVAVCYYDRQNDRADLRVDRYCSISKDQGKLWSGERVSNLNWLPSLNTDPLNPGGGFAISEYDVLTADFLRRGDGFFGAFVVEISGNQNVVATRFQ